MTTDNVILTGYVAENEGKFKLVGEQFTEEPYGIGVAKGDTAFCEFINETLAGDVRGRLLRGGVEGDRRTVRGHRGARTARRRPLRLSESRTAPTSGASPSGPLRSSCTRSDGGPDQWVS